MKARRRRGNVLITALFMAIFLFFLSVALISQNRMDISLGLSVDHRLKADSAARAGMSWALQTMRTRADWAATLQGPKPVLESGATFQVEVRTRSDDSGDPNLLLLTCTGTSGLISTHHWAVVEEVDKTPKGQKGTAQLFTRCFNEDDPPLPNNLAMLGSDFQWYDLGPLPAAETTLEAGGGPLFLFGPEGSAQEPPSVVDFLPLFLPETGEQTQGPMTRLELVPPGRHLLTLTIKDGAGEWMDVPDPGPQLGSWAGLTEINSEQLKALPVIRLWEDPSELPDDRPPWDRRNVHLTGRGNRTSGFEIFTLDSDLGVWNEETEQYESITTSRPWKEVVSKSLDELTLDWDKITDTPLVYLEWYSLTGVALSARKDKIACQGLHLFYGHIPIPEQTFPDLGTPLYESIVVKRPCVLVYDLKKQEWSRVVDLMSVPKKNADPQVVGGPEWKDDFLEVDSEDRAWITVKRKSDTELVRFDSAKTYNSFGKVPGRPARVVVYDDQPFYVAERQPWIGQAETRKVLQGFRGGQLDPDPALGADIPAVTAMADVEGTVTEAQLKPREQIQVGIAGQVADTTCWGSDLITVGYVRRHIENSELPQLGDYNGEDEHDMTRSQRAVTFLRYDGEGWQAWPGGVPDLLKTEVSLEDPLKLPVPSLTEKKILLYPSNLALGSYVDGYPDLRRYAVITAGFGQAPKLTGFRDD